MADNDKIVTKESLKDFYNQIQPYLNGGAHMGYTPVGTVISVMGNEAPRHYLKCDGSIYNIVDYEELANYFAEQFGLSNYFGGNGTTTFAVPDLRGEFLRGTGTNPYTNQGDGANVGIHQDATELPQYYTGKRSADNKVYIGFRVSSDATTTEYNIIDKADKNISKISTSIYGNAPADTSGTASTSTIKATTRPTNTSILYCIATKNIYIDQRLNYSTSESVVGTWIDGKPLYQKSFSGSTGAVNTDVQIGTISNVGQVINTFGTITRSNGRMDSVPSTANAIAVSSSGSVTVYTTNNNQVSRPIVITVQYTKSSD